MKHPDPRIANLLATLASPALATVDLSLDRVAGLLAALGNPQDKLPPVIHVAGTNGKGSLVAYLTAIFQAAGYRVHRYISPHLVRFNEQILLADNEIEDDALVSLLSRVAHVAKDHPVTFFEAATAAGFVAFAETPADVVLLETGLGGRLDATNMVKKPALTAITPVSLDHKEFLGETLAQIAVEKAGIIKRGVMCITGPQEAICYGIIERAANIISAPLFRYGKEWNTAMHIDGFHYRSQKSEADFPLPNLVGGHQVNNAGTAIACIENMEGFKIGREQIAQGITHAVWPARLEWLRQGRLAAMLPESSELWLDGGHNPAAGQVLAAWVSGQKKPVHVICGMLSNKDIKAFLAPLAQRIVSLSAVPIPDQPQSQDPMTISALAGGLGIKNAVYHDVRSAIEAIVKDEKNDSILLICGSLYLAGNILWQNQQPA